MTLDTSILTITRVDGADVPTFVLEGELDIYTAQKFKDQVAEFVEVEIVPEVALDFTRVTFVDMRGWACLSAMRQYSSVRIIAPRQNIRHALRVTCLDLIFDVVEGGEV